jgi:hypothetical protein
MSKQTAVEWLVKQLLANGDIRWRGTTIHDLAEQAKAMEREQIIQSNRDGVDMVVDKKPFVTGEQYYNENYGGKQ